jgi:hypothetical protein
LPDRGFLSLEGCFQPLKSYFFSLENDDFSLERRFFSLENHFQPLKNHFPIEENGYFGDEKLNNRENARRNAKKIRFFQAVLRVFAVIFDRFRKNYLQIH